jgi:hypothetical protein
MGSEASTHGDVYSYRIFVLEMFTGKRPTNTMFKDGFNLHNFVTMALPEKLVQIVDPNLFKREVNELAVATEEDDYTNNDHNCWVTGQPHSSPTDTDRIGSPKNSSGPTSSR